MTPELLQLIKDPVKFCKMCWPSVALYSKQQEIIYSVARDDETFVPAGNMLGKDFVSGFIVLWFFLTRHPCRIITTSAKEDHLRVLWGEMGRFIQTSRIPLDSKQGGPLIVNHRELRKMVTPPDANPRHKEMCKMSYVKGAVAAEDSMAAMGGHHIAQTGDGIPRTLAMIDEASSVNDTYYKMFITWANRILVIGNTWPCSNFFKHAIRGKPGSDDKGGDLPDPLSNASHDLDGHTTPIRYLRRVIKVTAEDSPNVRYAKAQIEKGFAPTNTIIVPGVLPYAEYLKRHLKWDKIQKTISLYANFYEGSEVMMFPSEWLDRAHLLAEVLRGKTRRAKGIGVDPAAGGDRTAMTASDEYGIIEQVSRKTPNTDDIPKEAKAFAIKHGLDSDPSKIVFDVGGGGQQHADRMRSEGWPVRAIAFGASVILDPKRGLRRLEEKVHGKESQYAYKNRRGQLFGTLREVLDPSNVPYEVGAIDIPHGFAIPRELTELRRQLEPIPLRYDGEGRLVMLPKDKNGPEDERLTLTELIGCSPDEADSLVLSLYAMLHKSTRGTAGVIR